MEFAPNISVPSGQIGSGHRTRRYCAPGHRRVPHAGQGAARTRLMGTKGDCKARSTALLSASCSLIVPLRSEFRIRTEFKTGVVGRERRVSRVRCRGVRPAPCEYGATPYDTPRLSAAAYWMRTGTPNLLSPHPTVDIAWTPEMVKNAWTFPYQGSAGRPIPNRCFS